LASSGIITIRRMLSSIAASRFSLFIQSRIDLQQTT
jgi:hypothetical protein